MECWYQFLLLRVQRTDCWRCGEAADLYQTGKRQLPLTLKLSYLHVVFSYSLHVNILTDRILYILLTTWHCWQHYKSFGYQKSTRHCPILGCPGEFIFICSFSANSSLHTVMLMLIWVCFVAEKYVSIFIVASVIILILDGDIQDVNAQWKKESQVQIMMSYIVTFLPSLLSNKVRILRRTII